MQLYHFIKDYMTEGTLRDGDLLPSTREMSQLIGLSRGTVTKAYERLEQQGYVISQPQRGYMIASKKKTSSPHFNLDWEHFINVKGHEAKDMDIIKQELPWKENMISFTSIAPNENLFDLDAFKKSFLNIYSLEGEKILNYGYAKGYLPLLNYLKGYMESLGVDLSGKDLIVTNGFTEGFNMLMALLTEPSDCILCENPTHHTAIKIMKLHGLKLHGLPINKDGIDVDELIHKLKTLSPKFVYLTPSYHNPTGIVLSPEKRLAITKACAEASVPILEDGFNEELRFNTPHCSPLISYCGNGNGVIYLGSFSKILFPGLRVGWILADRGLVDYLESYKRSLTIHTSFLDQALLYQYLYEGHFDRYVKKARKYYQEQLLFALEALNRYIPYERLYGEGGLHLFIKLKGGLSARDLLGRCYDEGVLFLPGDLFYLDHSGEDTLRLGISRVSKEQITEGFTVIGKKVRELLCE